VPGLAEGLCRHLRIRSGRWATGRYHQSFIRTASIARRVISHRMF
jgi:hypothetical protein